MSVFKPFYIFFKNILFKIMLINIYIFLNFIIIKINSHLSSTCDMKFKGDTI